MRGGGGKQEKLRVTEEGKKDQELRGLKLRKSQITFSSSFVSVTSFITSAALSHLKHTHTHSLPLISLAPLSHFFSIIFLHHLSSHPPNDPPLPAPADAHFLLISLINKSAVHQNVTSKVCRNS